MSTPAYGLLMQDGHEDELKEALVAKVTETAQRLFKEELSQKTIDRIPRIVETVVTERIPESGPDTSDSGGKSYLYCEDCQDAPCCYEREIGVSVFDATELAKALGISRKKFIKDHLVRYEGDSPALTNVAIYVLKPVNPFEFLDENARCRVYEARPKVCRIFPSISVTTKPYWLHMITATMGLIW